MNSLFRKIKNDETHRLEAMRCGLVVLEGGLVEIPPKELEYVVVPETVVSLPVVDDKTLFCLEVISRSLILCDRLPRNCLSLLWNTTFKLFVFLTGALDGLTRVPDVPFVWAANISGAIRAISGKEFGADAIVPRQLFESMLRCRSVSSGNLKWRKRLIEARTQELTTVEFSRIS